MFSTGGPEEQRPTLAEIWKSLREDFSFRRLVRGFIKIVVGVFVAVIAVQLAVQVGIALFGNYSKADEAVLKDTAESQADTARALFLTFDDFGRLDVRHDYSVYAYIPKKNFMLVPFPDRDLAITLVGKTWCENRSVRNSMIRMPMVQLRDIHSGEVLGSYRCLRLMLS